MLEVLADDPAHMCTLLNEVGVSGPARQTLDPERSGAGVQVEHSPADRPIALQHREQRLFDPIEHRASAHALRRFQTMALRQTCNNSHRDLSYTTFANS